MNNLKTNKKPNPELEKLANDIPAVEDLSIFKNFIKVLDKSYMYQNLDLSKYKEIIKYINNFNNLSNANKYAEERITGSNLDIVISYIFRSTELIGNSILCEDTTLPPAIHEILSTLNDMCKFLNTQPENARFSPKVYTLIPNEIADKLKEIESLPAIEVDLGGFVLTLAISGIAKVFTMIKAKQKLNAVYSSPNKKKAPNWFVSLFNIDNMLKIKVNKEVNRLDQLVDDIETLEMLKQADNNLSLESINKQIKELKQKGRKALSNYMSKYNIRNKDDLDEKYTMFINNIDTIAKEVKDEKEPIDSVDIPKPKNDTSTTDSDDLDF